MSELLSADRIDAALLELPRWRRAGDELRAEVQAPDFPTAIELVVAVARDAERSDHHPDIDIRWRTVSFTLTTHSAGGITDLDLQLARQIEAAAGQLGIEY